MHMHTHIHAQAHTRKADVYDDDDSGLMKIFLRGTTKDSSFAGVKASKRAVTQFPSVQTKCLFIYWSLLEQRVEVGAV